MIPVSIVIITKNEAEIIANCINTCKLITDNIVIVDNGSTDNTLKIAEDLGCEVYQESWDGYGANKNKGVLYAHYNWILSIDADEIPDQELINTLHNLNLTDPKIAFDIPFKNYFGSKRIRFGNWGYDHRIRLFNRHLVKWHESKVHEKLQLPAGIKVKRIGGHIHHYTVKNLKECDHKAIYYARLSANQYISNGKKISFLKIYVSPIFGFVKDYVLKLGFLDGFEGLDIALTIYKNTWLKYHFVKQKI